MEDANDDFILVMYFVRNRGLCLSRLQRGVRSRYASARLLRLRLRIPLGARLSVCCECCVLSGRGLGNGPIPRPEEYSTGFDVSDCDHEALIMGRPRPEVGLSRLKNTRLRQLYDKTHVLFIFLSG